MKKMCPFTQSSSDEKQQVPKSGFPLKEQVKICSLVDIFFFSSHPPRCQGECSRLDECGFRYG